MRLPINKDEEEMLNKFPVGTLVKVYDFLNPERYWVPVYLSKHYDHFSRLDLKPEINVGLVVKSWDGIPINVMFEDTIDDRGQYRIVLVKEQVVMIHSYFLHEVKHV